ncbi:MAG: Ig-like domain-containing protein [Cyclobacteriaceae bacterium]
MRHSFQLYFLLLLLLANGCIGTDYADDMVVPDDNTVDPINGRLLLSPEEKSLLPGDTTHLSVIGDMVNSPIEPDEVAWTSSNASVATVEDGVVTGLAVGQTEITAAAGELSTSSLSLITVIADPGDVARVKVIPPSGGQSILLLTGETLPLAAEVSDGNGNTLTTDNITWRSEDESVLTVDGDGVITALSEGTTTIKAMARQVASLALPVQVALQRPMVSGTFTGVNSYTAEGMVTLTESRSGDILMTFSEDFATDFALGTFVYMSNSTSGSNTRLNGLEVAEITEGGAKSFNLSALEPGITLESYPYVIILCKPASITFGYAEL